MNKKLIVIGAGIGQVNIVRLAKQMGAYVCVVSPKGDYPAIKLADELFDCDIYNRDAIVDFALQNGFNAVTSDQNDLMMPTVAYVAEKCGFPGNTYQQVLSYCDKHKFREICSEIDIPAPKHIYVRDDTYPKHFDAPFPWIVKPSDSQSSIGITKINDKNEYQDAVRTALSKSKTHAAVIEQYFIGEEFVCEGFVFHGKYYNLAFGDRKYFKDTLIPCQTIFPSLLDQEICDKIVECEERISTRINVDFGIVHSEYLVNKDNGTFCIVESAIRGGGVYISSHLIPLATGIDVNSILLKCVFGESVNVDDFFANQRKLASAYVCFTLPEGIVSGIMGIEKIQKNEGVIMTDIRNLRIGQITEKMTTKGQRKGPFIVSGKDRKDLELTINKIQQTVDVLVISKDGLPLHAIWS